MVDVINRIRCRLLVAPDFKNGFAETLSALSPVTDNFELLAKIFQSRISRGVRTYVIEEDGKIIATASMFIEIKYIHDGGKVAHIEDVAVHKDWQGKGLGKSLMHFLEKEAGLAKCYKIILDCAEDKVEFYRKVGYECQAFQMRKDLHDTP